MVLSAKLGDALRVLKPRKPDLPRGYGLNRTAAPGVTGIQRHSITSSCMSADSIMGLMRMCKHLTGAAPAAFSPDYPENCHTSCWTSSILATLPPPPDTSVAEEDCLCRINQT